MTRTSGRHRMLRVCTCSSRECTGSTHKTNAAASEWWGGGTHRRLILLTVLTPGLGALLQTDALLQDLGKVVLLYFIWGIKVNVLIFLPPVTMALDDFVKHTTGILYAVHAGDWWWRGRLKPTLSVVFRVMHGEQQRQRRADRLFAAATQTAVLHLTSEQFPDDRLTRGTKRTEQAHKKMIFSDLLNAES